MRYCLAHIVHTKSTIRCTDKSFHLNTGFGFCTDNAIYSQRVYPDIVEHNGYITTIQWDRMTKRNQI